MKHSTTSARPWFPGRAALIALLSVTVTASVLPGGEEPQQASATPGLAAFGDGDIPAPPWQLELLPNQKLPRTEFTFREVDGRRALEVRTRGSFGGMTHPFEPAGTPGTLAWTWKVGNFATGADLRAKGGDDNAIKVCASFDMPLDRLSWFERFVMKRARASTKRHLPAATVCYVWEPALPIGTKLANPFSKRLRYFVLRQGPARPGEWFEESRNLGKDFLELFGEESGGVIPPLLGISIGGDSDNTQGESVSWIAGISHRPIP